MTFTEGPPPLTPRQRAIFWIVAAVCAATRFLAMARSIWDWDEALFCLGMRLYDVANHHPHPPGFPLYIAAGRLVRVFVESDFRALQAINLTAGILLFPAMFMLARELRMRFTTSIIAAALCAFLPNIWFFGGTAFSDVPSLTLVVFAVAFLFRGCRSVNAYLIGTFLLALSIGIRPQNLLVGIFPLLIATRYRVRESWRDVLFAALIGTSVVAVTYVGAAHATGSMERYMSAIRAHGDYITRIDSFRSPDRPPLWRLFDRFFIKQYQSPALSIATSIFVLISVGGAIRNRDRSMLYNALTFAPFAISAWLMLDRYSVSRFSIGYAPMFAIFAADGIARVTRRAQIEALIGGALITAFALWTYPALGVVRREVAPSVLGVDAVQQRLDRRRDELFVAFSMSPFIDYLLPHYPYRRVYDERGLPLTSTPRRPHLLTEVEHTHPDGHIFRRARGRLWNISRRHYFEVALIPIKQPAQFVSGWYTPERSGVEEWRWMSAHSVTLLPPSKGTTRLRLQFDVPDELMTVRPTITIALNGAVIDRFQPPEAHLSRDYDVTPASAGANTLEITTDRASNAARQHIGNDSRDLGLLVRALSWGSLE